ncbi:MAG: carbohydrate ABC transporter permease [Acetobacteraceae bacterium]
MLGSRKETQPVTERSEPLRTRAVRRNRAAVRDRRFAFLLAAPAAVLVGVLMYYPMIGTGIESLYSVSFISPVPHFVGLANYAKVLTDPVFRTVVVNSLFWTVAVVAGQNVGGFLVALLLTQGGRGQGVIRSVMLLPWVLPGVVVAILWRFMFDPQLGLINSFLIRMGLVHGGIAWLGDTRTALPAAIIAAIWKGFPFSAVVYLAGLQGVDRELLEVAMLDGAGAVRRLIHVVLPSMRPVIATNVLITTILTFNYFDMIWVLTRGGPEDATQIFPTRIYELGFGQFRFGQASVYGVFSILVLALVVAAILISQRRQLWGK